MASSSLVIPVVLWGSTAPTHCISAVLITTDQKTIVTGCHDGQICLWDLNDMQVVPRNMLLGHSAAITCLARASESRESSTFISAAENGELCLWDVSDGRCIEQTRVEGVPTVMHTYHATKGTSRESRIICHGYYPNVHIFDATSLELLFTLSSKFSPDWISALCVIRPLKRQEDVVIGISNSGKLKVWNLCGAESKNTEPHLEEECKPLRCYNAQSLSCCAFTLRTVLIVCSKHWQIYDAGDFSQLCSEDSKAGYQWCGGDFISGDRVIIWSSQGKGYLYQLPTSCIPDNDDFRSNIGRGIRVTSHPFQFCILEANDLTPLTCAPVMTFFYGRRGPFYKLFIRGDSEGCVTVWRMPEISDKELSYLKQEEFDTLPVMPPSASNSLTDLWKYCSVRPAGIIDQLSMTPCDKSAEPLAVTASIYLPDQGWLVCGRKDGSIVIVPAVQTAIVQLLEGPHTARRGWPPHRILRAHQDKVTCLLYPHQEHPRYDATFLVSGGVDFSICLWDIFSGNLLHTFCMHGGEVTRMVIPPENCNARVLGCICTVASDHSVALLGLRDRKCIMLASRHLFPIKTIKWRPTEDFLVVGCEDGSVFVWQMETGHLDRIAQGVTAEDILDACDHVGETIETMLTPGQSIAQAFRRRSLSAIKNAAHRHLATYQGSYLNTPSAVVPVPKNPSHALSIQAMRTHNKDADFHVLFFDTEVLVVHLLTDENLIPGIVTKIQPDVGKKSVSPQPESQSPKLSQRVAGFLTKQIEKQMRDSDDEDTDQVSSSLQPPRSASRNHGSSNRKTSKNLTLDQSHLTLDIAQLFMSCLHAWGLDSALDRICLTKLGLLKPHSPVSFGLLSHGAYMSLMLPGWHRIPSKSPSSSRMSPDPSSITAKEALELKKREQKELSDNQLASDLESQQYLGHWELSRAVTTQHLISVISVANTLMSMNNASFVILSHLRKGKPKKSGAYSDGDKGSDDPFDNLADLTPEQALIKQGWSLLAALHCVLLPDLLGSIRYKPPHLEMLARRWQDRCLEVRAAAQALLLAELRRIGIDGREEVIHTWAHHLPNYVDSSLSLLGSQSQASSMSSLSEGSSNDSEEHEEEILSGDSPTKKVSTSFESRRKQATAIVMLGVIGAEFGAEIQPSRLPGIHAGRQVQQGFGMSDYSLARHTAQALAYLLLEPPKPRLPAHTPIRRAAIDLLGRGFTVWEPFIDVSAVFLGLLELCSDPNQFAASISSGLPITPAADSSRSSHHSLSLIATARPATFITTIAKEIARYQALASNNQTPAATLQANPLGKARAEILRIVELLIEKMQNDVMDLMIEVMDIVVHCLDQGQLKTKGLLEIFPCVCRFNMLSYCHSTKRIAAGAKTGLIAIYDAKTGKSQTISGHATAVTAISFSADGKYLASYAFGDTKLCFWQTGSSLLGGMISSATKCVKAYKTKPFTGSFSVNQLRQVSLSWPQPRSVVLHYMDNSTDKFNL